MSLVNAGTTCDLLPIMHHNEVMLKLRIRYYSMNRKYFRYFEEMSKLQCLSLPQKASLGTYQLRVTVIDDLSWSPVLLPGRVQEVNDGRAAAPAEALLVGCPVNEDVLRVLQQPSDKRAAPPTPQRPAGTVALSLGLATAHFAAAALSFRAQLAPLALAGAFGFTFLFYWIQGSIIVCQSKTD